MADVENHDEIITHFVGLTSASPAEAQQYLEANQWELAGAVAEYFTSQDESLADTAGEEDPQEAEPYTGPRTLDGRPAPAPIPTVDSSSKSAAPKRKGFATLGSLGSGPSGGHDDDSDDSDDDEKPRDLFAGGEKSALAVQDPSRNDPRKVVKDILKKAKSASKAAAGESSSAAAPSRFHGSGQTLGGEDTPSQTIPDAHPQARQQAPVETRSLHLWEDGFSVEDGPLRRFDDPQHARDLEHIRQGRAPLHLMGIRPDQPVDVSLVRHEEPYKAPPKVYKPFSGGGHRLGSPTPGGPSTVPVAVETPAVQTQSTQTAPEPEIDSSQPTVSLRIQLANGTRLPARFNTNNTIGDVYAFIERAAPNAGRSWVLATTFPNKEHTEKELQLGDVPEFKKGGTVVQKWT